MLTRRRSTLDTVSSQLSELILDPEHGTRLARELRDELSRRRIYFGDTLLPSFPGPDLLCAAEEADAGDRVQAFVGILERVGEQVIADRGLRRRLGFEAHHDNLLDVHPGYDRFVVISRLDMALQNGGAIFEVNTDSPAMMTFTDKLEDILFASSLGEILPVRHRPDRFTKALLESLVACFKEWGGSRDDPTIAIVDWSGEMTASELLHTSASFTELGCPTVVCNPNELSVRGGAVHAQGHRIDIIQRRVLFPDFFRRESELKVFSEAYRRGIVCVANPLRAITVGNKSTLALLSEHQGCVDLEAEDWTLVDQLLPRTVFVTKENFDSLASEKDLWVIKGSFGSGGKAVELGVTSSPAHWRRSLGEGLLRPTVAQHKRPIPVLKVPHLVKDHIELRALWANYNPWVFGGCFVGGSTRVSRDKIVSITAGGGLLPAIGV